MKKIFIGFLINLFIFAVAFAADFGGVGGKPAHPDPNILHSDQWFIYTLKPGESRQDELLVQNSNNEPADIILYPADSTPSTDGGFALEQMVEPRDFVGAWIKLSQTEIHLGPNESEIVPFTITVPNDPKLDVGEHTGGILIQKINQGVAVGGMQLLTRTGVRVYVTIPGEIIKKLEIEKFSVEFDKKRKIYIVSATVKNSGNVGQDITIHTRIENMYPLLNRFFKQFPITNERNLQALRDSSLISNFEFKKPLFGKLKIKGWMNYDNNTKMLAASPVVLTVLPDQNIIILLILIVIFVASFISFVVFKKYDKKKTQPKKKR